MTSVTDAVREGTRGDQKRHGTFHMSFIQLHEQYERLMKAGGNAETMRDALCELLRGFENERTRMDQQIQHHQREIDYARAMQRACSQFSNTLVSILYRRAGEWERAPEKGQAATAQTPSTLADGSKRLTEEEARQLYCVCGCTDDIDAADCGCPCHGRGYCDNTECVPCKEHRSRTLVQETTGRRKAPAPKKRAAPKKKATKKAPKK